MTIRKFCKTLAVVLTGVLMMAFLGGCGSSDKFAGHWIGYGKTGYPEADCIYDITIEKNGDKNSYLVNITEAHWKTYSTSFVVGKDTYKSEWKVDTNNNITAIAKDDKLTMQGPGSPFFTYIDKDKSLQLSFVNEWKMGQQEQINLQPAKENELQDFKDKMKAELQKKFEEQKSQVTFKD